MTTIKPWHVLVAVVFTLATAFGGYLVGHADTNVQSVYSAAPVATTTPPTTTSTTSTTIAPPASTSTVPPYDKTYDPCEDTTVHALKAVQPMCDPTDYDTNYQPSDNPKDWKMYAVDYYSLNLHDNLCIMDSAVGTFFSGELVDLDAPVVGEAWIALDLVENGGFARLNAGAIGLFDQPIGSGLLFVIERPAGGCPYLTGTNPHKLAA